MAHDPNRRIIVTPIVENVPVPSSAIDRSKLYPVEQLKKPGQSFFASGGRQSGMASSIYDLARRLNIRVKCALVVEKDVPGVRVWRMPDDWKPPHGGRTAKPKPAP